MSSSQSQSSNTTMPRAASVWQDLAAAHSGRSSDDARVCFSPLGVQGLLVLRAGAKARDDLSRVVSTVCGLSLPERLSSHAEGERCLYWISPDEWWLKLPLADVQATADAINADKPPACAVVDVSAGYEFMHLSGASAPAVLMKSTAYPIDQQHLPSGKVVNTTLSKAQLCMRVLPNGAFELIVRRSFADYVWRWLTDASTEYGWYCADVAL